MSTTTTPIKSVSITVLPAIGADLDGGAFFGITTRKDGTHCAAVLLPAQSDKRLPWKPAMAWAAKQGGELPSRPVAAMLFANLKDKLTPNWHWTSAEDDASYAWGCDFDHGGQYGTHESYEGSVVAVRLIPLTA
jgi:hypothetical protein